MAPEFSNDGPHSPDLTRAAADQIAELIRFLNYATLGDAPGLKYPADVDSVAAALYSGTGRMPQLFDQLVMFLAGQNEAGILSDAQGRDVDEQVAMACYHLGDARGYAMQLTSALQAVQNAISGLHVRGERR
jgi:hypothetical protein